MRVSLLFPSDTRRFDEREKATDATAATATATGAQHPYRRLRNAVGPVDGGDVVVVARRRPPPSRAAAAAAPPPPGFDG